MSLIKVEIWDGSTSKGGVKKMKKRDKVMEEETGCWVMLSFGTCMPSSRSKVGSTTISFEEFFGATCEELLDRALYLSETALPAKICSKVGHKFLLEIRINQRGELFLRNIQPNEVVDTGSDGDVFANEELSKIIATDEPSLETPQKNANCKVAWQQRCHKKVVSNINEKEEQEG